MEETDNFLDVAIAFGCCLGLVGFIAYEIGQYQAAQNKNYCAATLADGRQLTTTWLGPQGHAQCTYAPVYGGSKKYRRG